MVEDILAENIIGPNWENYWSKTIDQKDSSNFACILHPNTFPEKANPFFSHDILVFGGVANFDECDLTNVLQLVHIHQNIKV